MLSDWSMVGAVAAVSTTAESSRAAEAFESMPNYNAPGWQFLGQAEGGLAKSANRLLAQHPAMWDMLQLVPGAVCEARKDLGPLRTKPPDLDRNCPQLWYAPALPPFESSRAMI